MLSRLVIASLPRSKRLLISWLQSPSAVILEPTKIKSVTVSTVSPSICHSYPFKDPCYWSAAVSNLLRPRGLQHTGFPVCHYFPDFAQTHIHWVGDAIQPSILCRPFSCHQFFPTLGSFPMSWLFISGGQSNGASTSVLPVNMEGWFPLGLTGLISCCPRDSQESSPVWQFESTNSLVLSLFYSPTLTSIHEYRKNHSFD